jgi:ubiquinone/menaquinone biosynthesis C-methylase UbiE
LNQAIKQKLSDVHSWEELLSKYEHYSFEMQKPASLGALWSKIHLKNAEEILGDMKNMGGFGILDIGCGGGWFAKLVSEKGGVYVGIDLSPSFCQIALTRIKYYGIDGAIVCGDAEYLPFRSHIFENAFTYEAMHHLPEPFKGIREALRVSHSFTLGDEPAKLPKPIEFLTVNVLKRSFKEREPSGYESYRFDPKPLKISLEQKGYVVMIKRQWTYVPKIFSKHEENPLVASVYLSIYSILMKFFKPFSHALTVHVEPNRVDNDLVFRENSSKVSSL